MDLVEDHQPALLCLQIRLCVGDTGTILRRLEVEVADSVFPEQVREREGKRSLAHLAGPEEGYHREAL